MGTRTLATWSLIGILGTAIAVADPVPGRSNLKGSSAAPPKQQPRQEDRRADRSLALLRHLHSRLDRVDFQDLPLEEVFDWLKHQGLKNLVVQWGVIEGSGDIDRQIPVYLEVQDIALGEVLDLVLEQASERAFRPEDQLTYHVFDGLLRISTVADFDSRLYTRAYHVENLLYPIMLNALLPFLEIGSQFAYVTEVDPVVAGGAVAQRPIIGVIDSGVHHGPGYPEDGLPDFDALRQTELDKLINLLKSVRPASWQDNGGRGTIAAFGEKLVITQTIEMHEIIGGAFEQSRDRRPRSNP